jgi:hypothetical protein
MPFFPWLPVFQRVLMLGVHAALITGSDAFGEQCFDLHDERSQKLCVDL